MKILRLISLVCTSILFSSPCHAHGFAGSGLIHPLTGVDHMLAMIAVGAWSAQLGRRYIFWVPGFFVMAMLFGGIFSFGDPDMIGFEVAIGLSVLLLGLAIALEQKTTMFFAALAVGVFGACHGYAHGIEMMANRRPWVYVTGFLTTTAGLHILGAVGALLLLEEEKGQGWLRLAGTATAVVGGYLVL